MEQENIQTDTPQEGANEKQYQSLEDAVFSGDFNDGSGNISDVFTTGNEGETKQEAAPVQQEQAQPSAPVQNEQTDNDQKRFQYWQSQADKLKNENARLQAQLQQPAQAAPVAQETQEEAFPDAPGKPERPLHFSREEALSDPQSESARYIDSVEAWRDDMVEYTALKNEYNNAIQQEKFDNLEKQRQENIKRAQAEQQMNKQKNDLADYVIGNHGFSESDAVDFVNKMSDPSSINVDNLVQLYRLSQGQPVANQNTTAPAPTPSADFQQVQNAQQVPSPMGVLPSGQGNTDGRSMEDKIMDTMIGNFDSKNPWK